MNCCVGGTKRKYALNIPVVPKIWPIQAKTNPTQDEIKSLEEARFVLNKQQPIFLQSLFGRESSNPINRLVDEMCEPWIIAQ
jgi:hypothetical protein